MIFHDNSPDGAKYYINVGEITRRSFISSSSSSFSSSYSSSSFSFVSGPFRERSETALSSVFCQHRSACQILLLARKIIVGLRTELITAKMLPGIRSRWASSSKNLEAVTCQRYCNYLRNRSTLATYLMSPVRCAARQAQVPLCRLPRDVRDKSATNSWRPL